LVRALDMMTIGLVVALGACPGHDDDGSGGSAWCVPWIDDDGSGGSAWCVPWI